MNLQLFDIYIYIYEHAKQVFPSNSTTMKDEYVIKILKPDNPNAQFLSKKHNAITLTLVIQQTLSYIYNELM